VTVDTINNTGQVAHAGPPASEATVSSVVATYATDLQHCASFAEAIVDTPFVPASLWPAPVIRTGDNVTALKASGRDGWDFRRRHPRESDEEFAWRRRNAVATTGAIVYSGANLGLNWQAALSGIYVANGRTSLYAEQIRALILAAGHEFDIVERGDEQAIVSVRRRGESTSTEFTFTLERAIRAGYVKGKGPNVGQDAWKGNDKYNTDAPAMLFARVTTIAASAKFPDVTRGMVAREVIDDERHTEPVDISDQVEVRRPAVNTREILARPAAAARAGRAAPAAAQGLPLLPGEDDPVEDPLDVAPLEQSQWRAINAEFVRLDVVGDGKVAARLAVISHLVGREVVKGSDLTAAEGQLVLDNLAGNGGFEVVGAALGNPDTAAASEQPTAEPAEYASPGALPDEPAGWPQATGDDTEGEERADHAG
jgi:hypothetical protein